VGIISYCLLTLFSFFLFLFIIFFSLSFVGAAIQPDTVPEHGAANTSQTTAANVDSRDQPTPPK
jgi:Na+-transporting methylmalonyl-CoA/oxaloacetate decarboxylase gamma subunit